MRAKYAWAFALYAVMAMVITWPTVSHLTEAIPLGSESAPTVPLFNLWTLGWNVERFLDGYRGYWDAPIFYPSTGTFAFSDPQPLTGVLATPFWRFGPAASYNLILFLFVTLNALAAFTLLRGRDFAIGPAFLGGLLVGTLPFLAHERGVLQLQPLFGALWAIDGLWRWAASPRWRSGLQIGLGISVTFLTSEYYALFLAVLLATAVPFLPPFWHHRRFWLTTLSGVVVVLLLILPVALPQLASIQEMGFSRSAQTIARSSALPADYLHPSPTLRESDWLPWRSVSKQSLFPGIGLVSLALAGALVCSRQPGQRPWIGYLLFGTAIALLMSLGPNLRIGSWQPYSLLRVYVPGFSSLRSPFRLGHFVQVYTALLAATFLAHLWQRGRRGWSVALAMLVVFELAPYPSQLTSIPPTIQTQAIRPPAIILPFPESGATAAFAKTTGWMVSMLAEPVSLVNGYSGFFPRLQSQLRSLLADFPTPRGLAALRALGVQTILIEAAVIDSLEQAGLATSVAQGDLTPAAPADGFLIFDLPSSQLNPIRSYTGAWVVEVRLRGKTLQVRAYAAVPDAQVYVADPELSPLNWRVAVTGPDGKRRSFDVSPPGTLLLYHGSDRWLLVQIPRPPSAGTYTIIVQDLDGGRTLGGDQLVIP